MSNLIISPIYYLLFKFRRLVAPVIRLFPLSTQAKFNFNPSLKPISKKYGFDRGQPIDRYYIEKFLSENQQFIQGHCLEIGNNYYTTKYGGQQVIHSDVLDIDHHNHQANLHADLRQLTNIADKTYDCLIITHTLGMIDQINLALKECHRVLKPGGVILFTGSMIGPLWELEDSYWKFTPTGTKYLFSQMFPPQQIKLQSYGNLLTAQAFLSGLAAEEITDQEINYHDPHYPVIVSVKATKPTNKISKK